MCIPIPACSATRRVPSDVDVDVRIVHVPGAGQHLADPIRLAPVGGEVDVGVVAAEPFPQLGMIRAAPGERDRAEQPKRDPRVPGETQQAIGLRLELRLLQGDLPKRSSLPARRIRVWALRSRDASRGCAPGQPSAARNSSRSGATWKLGSTEPSNASTVLKPLPVTKATTSSSGPITPCVDQALQVRDRDPAGGLGEHALGGGEQARSPRGSPPRCTTRSRRRSRGRPGARSSRPPGEPIARDRAIVSGFTGVTSSAPSWNACATGRQPSGCAPLTRYALLLDRADRDELLERPVDLRQQGAARDRHDDVIGQAPAELLGGLEPERLRALRVVRAACSRSRTPTAASPRPRRTGGSRRRSSPSPRRPSRRSVSVARIFARSRSSGTNT